MRSARFPGKEAEKQRKFFNVGAQNCGARGKDSAN